MKAEWIFPDWPAPRGVRSLITTRSGGVSRGPFASMNLGDHVGDDASACSENRARLRAILPADPLWLRQVHGTHVVEAPSWSPDVGMETKPQADGAVSRTQGAVIGVLTADCLPVLFCDADASVVGVAHAGWRGLASGILEATIAKMGADPGRLMAYLGPGIGVEVYEVGEDVRDAFVRSDPGAVQAFMPHTPGKFFADLYLLARQRLRKTGIMSVHGGQFCTFAENDRFFSYRRDGPTGRMASLVWIE
jgi:YfiH family protein